MSTKDERAMRMFWWCEEPNFGDAMSPWLVEQLIGSPVCWHCESGKFVGLGSVLWAARPGDTVWGTGLHPFSNRWWPNWSATGMTFLAVRGPLTRDYVLARGGDCPPRYGDPAELLPYLYTPTGGTASSIGIIPHIHDDQGRRFADQCRTATTIDPRNPWQEVVDQIVACEMIWSSSLHGIIVAEAFGIPAVWIGCGEGELKYRDYYLASGRTSTKPVAWDVAASSKPLPLPPRVSMADHPLAQSLRQWQAGWA